MLASIQDLPDELVLTIIDHLTPASLLNLNLTSRRLYNLTVAQIYRYFDGPRLSRSLRTIASSAQHPCKLAGYVKKVKWNASARKVHANRGIRLEDKDAIARAYQSFHLALPDDDGFHMDRFFTRNFRGSIASRAWFLEFVLAFLPNVSEFEVYNVWQWSDYMYW